MMEQKITEVVAALIVKDHRFLICQRPAHKARGMLWEFVGGKVEPGETLPQALIRECLEELGIRVTPQEIFMQLEVDLDGGVMKIRPLEGLFDDED